MIKTKGIDISYCQPALFWNALSVDFVIARAGYGRLASQKDKMFEEHYINAKKYNIPIGAYWYSYAMTEDEAKQEAKACIEVLKGKQFEYPIWYDMEEQKQYALGKVKVSAIINAFCSELEAAGYFVGVYTNASWYNTVLEDRIKTRFATWIAHWDVDKPGISGPYTMWQYKVGPLAGIQGDVDQDYCYTDYPTIIKKAGLNGYIRTPELLIDIPNKIHVVTIIDGKKYEGDLIEEK